MRSKHLANRTRPVTSIVLAALLIVSAIPLGGGAALAFKPDRRVSDIPSFPGLDPTIPATDMTHPDITEKAIKELIERENLIPGTTEISCLMTKAIDKIKEGATSVDYGETYLMSAPHFTDEDFAGGQYWIDDNIQATVNELESNNVSAARYRFGMALHAVQDFYAHSNWVELGHAGTINALVGDAGATGTLISMSAGNEATCGNCPSPVACPCDGNIITGKLTTSYFRDFTVPPGHPTPAPKPNGKCSHGGTGDKSAGDPGIGGINKDTSTCFWSPQHGQYHQAAARLAVEHTKHILKNLSKQITRRQLKALLGAGSSLAFAIDTTGSMGREIEDVREQAIAIVNARRDTDDEPLEYVLVDINDPQTLVLSDTMDADEFIADIKRLHASGGGDCPEKQQTGLLGALGAMDYGGELIMFTDASANDDHLAENVRSLAREKDVRISTAASGSCSPIDPEYYRTATETGGQVFVISRSEADNLTPLVDFLTNPDAVEVLAVSATMAGAAKSYSVPVDPSLRRVTFSVSGTSNVVLRRPDGSAVQPTDAGVRAVLLGQGRLYSVTAPPAGLWEVTATGTGNLSVRVSGESPLNFSLFEFVELAGRTPHEGYARIAGLPLAGRTGKIGANLVAPAGLTAQFELRAADGSLVRPLGLAEVARPGTGLDRMFFGDLETPATPFLVYVKGVDAAGKPYQRLRPGVIRPQTVKLKAPSLPSLQAGATTVYKFQVQNFGPAATFRLSARDNRGYAAAPAPASVSIDAGQTADVTVNFSVPAAARNGTFVTLTLSARSTGNAEVGNSAVVTGFVVSNRPPDVSRARPSVLTLWPPNHELAPVSVQGVTDPDGDPVTIRVLRITQDEPTNEKGDGNRCPDAEGLNSPVARLRAERNGRGNGRVYTVHFEAADGRGGITPGIIRVSVPHSQNGRTTDNGPSFDATACP